MREDEQRALCQLAYLRGTTAALAVALTGDADAPALLERLAMQSLFTQRRETAPPVYVFHALFAPSCAVAMRAAHPRPR